MRRQRNGIDLLCLSGNLMKLATGILVIVAFTIEPAGAQVPVANAVAASERIRVDGRLDEPVWRNATLCRHDYVSSFDKGTVKLQYTFRF